MKFKIYPTNINYFLKLTGDNNKIHYEDKYAQEEGFEKKIAPGMFTAALVLCNIHNHLVLENYNCIKIKWKKPVYPEENLIAFSFVDEDSIEIRVIKECKTEAINIFCYNKESTPKIPFTDYKEYNKIVGKEEIENFSHIINGNPKKEYSKNNKNFISDIFISCLVPPSLLMWSAGKGLHVLQEINIHEKANIQNKSKKITVKTYYQGSEKGNFHKGVYVCSSENKVLQTGKVICYLENKINLSKTDKIKTNINKSIIDLL
ncbi:MAG: MaoC family dehydratase [Candidatus Woesearchaeota archaeon]